VRRRVVLLPEAERELAALPPRTHDQLVAKIQLLYDFPEIGPALFDAYVGYRALLAARGTYRIIYRIISEGEIEVAYIRHCARQTHLRPIRPSRR
jgi:plasmid stabilization system protein ParE